MQNNITIAPALPNDAEIILEYLKIIGGETDNLLFGPEGLPFSALDEAKFIENINSSDGSIMLAAKNGEEIVGIGQLSCGTRARIRHRAELAISVKKAYWRQGIGSKLMTALIEYGRKFGVDSIFLEVKADNERAKAMYLKFGFEHFGTYKRAVRVGEEYSDLEYMALYL